MERLTQKHYDADDYYMVCSGTCSKEEFRCEDCHEFDKIVNKLGAYEDIEMTPEDIEQTMQNFSSFLVEMTDGHMSKTNYTVQAMVAEANDCFEKVCEECVDRTRLKQIEDILGDTCDLDQLRELVEGWRNGWLRVILTALKPGDSVYWLLEDDGWYISDPEKVADVGTKGFYLSGVRDSDEPGDNPSFIPWDEIGKTVFLSHEEAEDALEKMKEGV